MSSELPVIVSAKALPTTFSIAIPDPKVSVNPDIRLSSTVCLSVDDRSMRTAAFRREKSSLSVPPAVSSRNTSPTLLFAKP